MSLCGSLAPRPDQIKSIHANVVIVDWPIQEIVSRLNSIDQVSCSGAGRFPIMAKTLQKLQEFERTTCLREVNVDWSPFDLDEALSARLQVTDALAEAGFLYGPPLSKLREMGGDGESGFTLRKSGQKLLYGDGLHSLKNKKSKPLLQLGIPARVKSRHLMELPYSCQEANDFIESRKLQLDGKEVECLVAWLPSLRRMVLRALRNPNFNDRHARWVHIQNGILENRRTSPYLDCLEIINPEGVMQLGDQSKSIATTLGNTALENLTLAMVLGSYDADSLIAHLFSPKDQKKCSILQDQWTEFVVTTLESRKKTLIGMSGYNHDDADFQLNGDLSKLSHYGSRLIRFVLEQAAVNYAKGILRTSRELGLTGDTWPEESSLLLDALEILQEETHSIWPVVGIRMDYLIASQGRLLQRHLYGNWEKNLKKGPVVQYNEGYAPHNSDPKEEADKEKHDDYNSPG